MRLNSTNVIGKLHSEITSNLLYSLGCALIRILPKQKTSTKIMLAVDTRPSSRALAEAFLAGVLHSGGEVVYLGVMPTPAVFYNSLRKQIVGVMIGGGENTPEYNGYKLFLNNMETPRLLLKLGELISDYLEYEFVAPITTKLKKIDLSNLYINHLLTKVEKTLLKLRLDLAYGSVGGIAGVLMSNMGAEIIEERREEYGELANCACGANYISRLISDMNELDDIGIALDADGSRVIAVDRSKNIIDGDMIGFIIAIYLKEIGRDYCNVILGGEKTSFACEKALQNYEIELIRLDGEVYEIKNAIIEYGAEIYFQPDGEILLRGEQCFDGILASGIFINAIDYLKLDCNNLMLY